eukprot:7547576-Prorocentrum_lima.AAC.1
MSRADIAPFDGFMQRQAHKRKNKDLKFINRVLRYCWSIKPGIYFEELVSPVRVVVIADAAYRSNED